MKKEMDQLLCDVQVKIIAVTRQFLMCLHLLHLPSTSKELNPGLKKHLQCQHLTLLPPLLSIICQCMQFQVLVECSIRLSLELLFSRKFLALQICTRLWERMVNPSLGTSNQLLLRHPSSHHHSHQLLLLCRRNLKYRLHHLFSPTCRSPRVLLHINHE